MEARATDTAALDRRASRTGLGPALIEYVRSAALRGRKAGEPMVDAMVEETVADRIARLEQELEVARKAYRTDMAAARRMRRKDRRRSWEMAFGAAVLLVQSAHRLQVARREANVPAA
jgi:hypothetical protein